MLKKTQNPNSFFKKMNGQKRIYMDYAAATPVDEKVLKAMKPFWSENFGNPGAIHKEGVIAKNAVEESRKKISRIFKCHNDEVIFTSSGTESNSMAVLGYINNLLGQGKKLEDLHIITTKMEHPSILYLFEKFEKKGVKVDYIGIDAEGIIDLKELRNSLKENTVLVSVMYANNEIGTIQPISKIAHILRQHRKNLGPRDLNPVFHCDASQAPLFLKLDVNSLGVDMMTIDGQKIYGPKGVGALYKKRDVRLKPLLAGGNQEMGHRAGTENVPLIVGLAKAFELADKEREKESNRLIILRDYFIDQVLGKIKNSILNGSREDRLPNNINISIKGLNSEFMIVKLDEKGIACASRSACMGKKGRESYVIDALGCGGAYNSLRFTIGKNTTKKQIDFVVKSIKESL